MGLFASDTVAIDIGSYAIKGAVIGPNRELKKFAAVPTPQGAIEGGAVIDPEQVTAALQTLWKSLGGKYREMVTVVPGQHVFVRHLSLPVLKKKELDHAVRFQAEGQIPITPTDMVVDYSVVKIDGAAKQTHVLLVVTKKTVVQQLVFMFKESKLKPKVFDIESLALARALFPKNRKSEAGELDVIASVGAANTHISIFEGDVPRFTRSIPFGGLRFTRALAHERSIELEEAEERKLAGEMPDEFQTLLEDLASEFSRTIGFFLSQNKDYAVRQVILTGGAAQMNGLADFLAEKLKLPVSLGQIDNRVKIPRRLATQVNLDAFRTTFAPVLGLALRGAK